MAQELAGSSPVLLLTNGGDNNGVFSTTGEFQNHFSDLNNNQDDGSVSFLQCTEAANRRIKETPKQNHEQVEVADTLLRLRPFGLKLKLTPCFLDLAEKKLNQSSHKAKDSEKLKASNFSASVLRIGKWERRSRNEGDLVAKCYYAKKKLVWELLDGGLKSKIEIQWNDIIGMRAFVQENQPGILELELNQVPTFYEENDPQPRKHTIWKAASDFTEGQASICRRHYLMFPPGSFDKNYENLVQCDPRLYDLCKKPFPSLQSPYFESKICRFANFAFSYHGDRPDNLRLPFRLSGSPSPLVATQHVHQSYEPAAAQLSFKETSSPKSVMDFSHSDEHISFEGNSRMALGNNAAGRSSISLTHGNQCTNLSSSSIYGHQHGSDTNFMNKMVISNLAEQLLDDTSLEGYDEKYHMARVESLNALVDLSQQQEEMNCAASENGSHQTSFYRQEMDIDDPILVLGANGQVYHQPQSVSGVPSLQIPQNTVTHQPWNKTTYHSVIHETRMDDTINHWASRGSSDGRFLGN